MATKKNIAFHKWLDTVREATEGLRRAADEYKQELADQEQVAALSKKIKKV
jgi:hypothetical protein